LFQNKEKVDRQSSQEPMLSTSIKGRKCLITQSKKRKIR